MTGAIAYAALFLIALPAALAFWARRLDQVVSLPNPQASTAGIAIAAAGMLFMTLATRDLWVHGQGLPASPFPPRRVVTRGIYGVLQHPIYVGAVLVTAGLALAVQSGAGLWIVAPVLAFSAAAFVAGFESDSTRRRFGDLPRPRLSLPEHSASRPVYHERLAVYPLVFLPWLVIYMMVEHLGASPDAISTYVSWDAALPVVPWTESVYAATYPFVMMAPFIAARRDTLRQFAVGGLWATAVIVPLYLLLPFVAEAKPVIGEGLWQTMMRWERRYDQPVTAFPAFHIVWFMLAADVYAERWNLMRRLHPVIIGLTGAACVTTGMHSVADVVAGFAAYGLVIHRRSMWRKLCDLSQSVANSWRERTIGPVRFMVHGAYAALGTFAGLTIAQTLAGSASVWWLAGMAVAAGIGAGLWAQLVEGSSQLLRPYGYFGAPLGVAAVAFFAASSGEDGWLLFTAFGTGSCFTQALGRLRCLVQGCCHGRPTSAEIGIIYTHPLSRVVRLAKLGGIPLHPTQLYSLVWMFLVGFALLRLWDVNAPLQFIAGTYFILVGLGRFVEEHFRGEPQTSVIGGLRLYQWLSIGFIIAGAGVTTLPPGYGQGIGEIDSGALVVFVAVALLLYLGFGADLPGSSRRFSRLR